jgi:uncharacterized cupin superfamily protein
LYILEGRAIAKSATNDSKLLPATSWGFATPSPPHTLINTFDEDPVYLMAGERNPNDIVHYPKIRRSMIKGPGSDVGSTGRAARRLSHSNSS